VEILEESPVSIDCMLNDPAAAAIMEEMHLSPEMVERLGAFIASVKLTGTKSSEPGPRIPRSFSIARSVRLCGHRIF
jgi:hypothetical protein